jgi:hypothetical protein
VLCLDGAKVKNVLGGVMNYSEQTTQDWVDKIDKWEWKLDEKTNEVYKVGKCPNCNHPMESRRFKKAYALSKSPLTAEIICNCTEPHEGRPDGKLGCGFGGQGFTLEFKGK